MNISTLCTIYTDAKDAITLHVLRVQMQVINKSEMVFKGNMLKYIFQKHT